jgi:hypothetical protein
MAFSDEIKRLVDLKVERLESIPDAFANRMVAIQRAKFSDVLDLLDDLDYKNGSLVVSQSNLLKIEQITEQIKEVLTSGEFESVVGELLSEFDEQAAITYRYFDASFDVFEVPTIANEILAQKKREAVIDLLNSTDQYLTNPMRQSLSNAVTTGASRKDLISVFKLLIEGDEDTVGRLERSTRQIVSDTFALNDRAITNEVAKQIKAEWFLYTGGLLKTTRPFCKSRNGNFYRRSEVESWGELGDWAGRMEGTNEKTIFVTAGGYNCQHSILPVSESVVPDKFK